MKKVIVIIAMVVMFALGACTVGIARAEQTNPVKIWPQNENGMYQTLIVVDEETGVNYIVVAAEEHGDAIGLGITPRLNKHGAIYVNGND